MLRFIFKIIVITIIFTAVIFFVWDKVEDKWLKPAKHKVERVIESGKGLIEEIKIGEKEEEILKKPQPKESAEKKVIKKRLNKKPENNVTEEERKRLQELIEERLKKD